jgi:glycosyltransferase involved in cell wall biosynthesis
MKKKIALASNTSWYLYNFRRNTIRAFLLRDYDVICLAPVDSFSPRLEALGATYVPVPMNAAGTNPVKELLLFLRILLILNKVRPDILFNFTIKMNVYFGFAARLLSIPYVNNISGLGTAFIHNNVFFRAVRYVYGMVNKRAMKVFFQNPDDLELFVKNGLIGGTQPVLLPGSGVDTHRFAYSPVAPGNKPFTFLMIARLIADKGVREYVKAAHRIKALQPDVRFVLVGPGGISNRSAIGNDEIRQWRKAGVVELRGEQEDVLPWIQDCDVVVLPSYREGMPRVVLEAAAVGRPAIVTDVPGCRHAVVVDSTGWLCKVGDVDSLSDAMRQVLTLPETELARIGENAARHVRAHFSEERVIAQYLKCLEELGD